MSQTFTAGSRDNGPGSEIHHKKAYRLDRICHSDDHNRRNNINNLLKKSVDITICFMRYYPYINETEKVEMKTGIEKIADKATDGKLVDSRLMKIAEAMNKLHSAYCACDDSNRKFFKATFGKMTIMEAIKMFGEMDKASAKIED
tara:strand:+ start:248 stop:682 length:435 start_codon:yes stop_codon:yes gene_type:complete